MGQPKDRTEAAQELASLANNDRNKSGAFSNLLFFKKKKKKKKKSESGRVRYPSGRVKRVPIEAGGAGQLTGFFGRVYKRVWAERGGAKPDPFRPIAILRS